MTLENIGSHNVRQMTQNSRSEQVNQHAHAQQMDKLLNTHNHIMTKILQQGLSIPQDTFEKIQREATPLKRFFFGLDNQLFEYGNLPAEQGDFVVFYTKSIPLVIPAIFFENGYSQADIFSEGVTVNLLKSERWWEHDKYELELSKFLKVGLIFFSHEDYVKVEKIRDVKIVQDPYLPEKAIVFSMSCNFFALLMFFYNNKQFFASLNIGLNTFLRFVSKT